MTDTPASRIGVFGGAFDPPHRVHVALAQTAIAQLSLDLLHVVPTGTAWHKARSLSPASHRLAMCRLAFAGIAGVRVDTCEIERRGPSFTVDTLSALQSTYPGARLYLIIGEDQARALDSWHRIEDIRRAATICVAVRKTEAAADAPLCDSGVQLLQMPASSLSATEIRQLAAQGHSVSPLVPEPVARYIDQHHLYLEA